VRPHTLEPRQRILELRQLDGQPGLVRLRTAGENIENDLGAVEHLDAERFFQVADLRRREIVVEDHHVGVGRVDEQLDLFDLAVPDVGGRIGRLSLLGEPADNFGARRFDQAGEFVERIFVKRVFWKLDAHQDGGLALDALLTVV
jgi:hypothetical protein